MEEKDYLFNIYSLYNLSRYAFLKIESNYGRTVEETGITLPQLRVLWIIKAFPGISLVSIAQLGFWSSPTVSNMIKILEKKQFIFKAENSNRKIYKMNITKKGEEIININKQNEEDKFYLFKLRYILSEQEKDFVIDLFKNIMIKSKNEFIFEYVDKINQLNLKIETYGKSEQEIISIKKIICIYNFLRIFILYIENNHRNLLEEYNLTYPQLRALWIIQTFEGSTSYELSQLSFWSPSTANLIVKNLYNKELIYKEKSSIKNALYLYISDKGKNLIIQEFKTNQKTLKTYQCVKFINEEDIIKINEILLKINIGLGNDMVKTYIDKSFKLASEY